MGLEKCPLEARVSSPVVSNTNPVKMDQYQFLIAGHVDLNGLQLATVGLLANLGPRQSTTTERAGSASERETTKYGCQTTFTEHVIFGEKKIL